MLKTLISLFIFLSFNLQLAAQVDEKRRKFLRCSLAFTASMGLTYIEGKTTGNIFDSRKSKPKEVPKEKIETSDTKLSQTSTEALFITIGNNILSEVVKRIAKNNTHGNAKHRALVKELQKYPVRSLVDTAILSPVIEELLFRGALPLVIGKSWTAGVLSNLGFAYLHNYNTEQKFEAKRIPTYQFLSGIYYWYLMKHRGLDHAILGHVTGNSFGAQYYIIEDYLKKSL